MVYTLLVILTPGCEKDDNPSENTEFSGQLTEHSECKNLEFISVREETPDTLSCVKYSFNDDKLVLKHINAGFNCCPDSLYVNASLNGDTIVIEEYETSMLCDCNCLYDLDIELKGIEAQKYHIKFVEPYVTNQEKIFFDINLENNGEGKFCVIRKGYPWGY
ncbi:MAG: hypothetical protein CSB01_01755 [Bacteroidia bacterium]|nr:MAG: hypothetical protein CSB01_01755 [Bacteroidia bacterium]